MDGKSRSIVKFVSLVVILALAIYIFRFSPVSDSLSYDSLRAFVESFGAVGFSVFVLLYAIAAALSVPGTVLTFVGAILFGTWLGTVLNLVGATLGAMIAFFLSQYLGRDFVQRLLKGRFDEFQRSVKDNGFSVILLLRLVPIFPYIGINYAAGLTNIKFKDYSLATFLGMIPGAFVYTYLFATLGEAVLSGDFGLADLLTFDVLLPIGLFVLLIIGSSIARKKMKKRKVVQVEK